MEKKTKLTNALIVALLLCGLAWIISIFVHVGGEFTDNAQVTQNLVNVNTRVQGFVKKIYVDDFQKVKKGDTLLVIEDAEYKLYLAQSEASLASAQAQKTATSKGISTIQNNATVTDAGIAELEILLKNAENDLNRYKSLYQQNAVTKQQLESMETQYESLKAKVLTMKQQRLNAVLASDEQSARVEQTNAGVDVAEAAINLARLNLNYCTIIAPCDGYTSHKIVQEGELVMTGQRLFTIVDDEDRWIIANFRETQCRKMKVGNVVKIKIDAFPDEIFEGEVYSFSNATGAIFSSMAPDNATGNFVKVEQRIPVKILFTKNNDMSKIERLSAGMNAEITVKTK